MGSYLSSKILSVHELRIPVQSIYARQLKPVARWTDTSS